MMETHPRVQGDLHHGFWVTKNPLFGGLDMGVPQKLVMFGFLVVG